MKNIMLFASALLMGTALNAQELPQASPAAKIQQRVGVTDITLEYSRPSVKDRTIFGELVPYDKLWRTGANAATTITLSTDAMINGEMLPAGSYAIFTIPAEGNWTVIFNKNTEQGGTGQYDESLDALRTTVSPTKSEKVESFRITVENITSESADIVLAWENTSVAIPLEVETHLVAQANIEKVIAENPEDWQVYRNAANYYSGNNIKPELALEYIQHSLGLKSDNWYSHYLHAEILLQNGDKDGALEAANKALEVGKSAAGDDVKFAYAGMIESFISKL